MLRTGPTGTCSFNFHCTQTLRARRQLLHEEELAFGRSKMEEFCEEIGQTDPHANTVDKKSKEVKKLKKVKFAVDTFKDSRIAKIKRTRRRMQNCDEVKIGQEL